MPDTVIDALVVELGLDPGKLATGEAQAQRKMRDLGAGIERMSATEAKAMRASAEQRKETEKAHGQALKENERRDRDFARAKERAGKEETRNKLREAREQTRIDMQEGRERFKYHQQAAKAQQEEWNRAKQAVLGFGAAFASMATVKLAANFVERTAGDVAGLGRTSHNIGLPTQLVRAWSNAVEQSGGSADGAQSSLGNLAAGLAGLQTGDTSLLRPLNEIGVLSGHPVDFRGPNGQFVDPLELLKRIMESTKAMNPTLRAVELGKLGLDAGTINAGAGGRAAMDAAIQAAIKADVPNDKEAQKEAALQAETVKLEQAFKRIGELLVLQFAPDITRMLADFGSIMEYMRGLFSGGPGKSWSDVTNDFNQHKADAQKQRDEVRKILKDESQDSGGKPDTYTKPSWWPEADGRGSHWPWARRFAQNYIDGFLRRHSVDPPPKPSANQTFPGGAPSDVLDYVSQDATNKGLKADWLRALFRAERGGYRSVSPSGAFGPAQLMPGTAGHMGVATSPTYPSYDWQRNADAGIRYFLKMLQMFGGRYDGATVAYHDGPNAPSTLAYAATGSEALMGPQSRAYLAGIQAMTASAMRFHDWDTHRSSANQTEIHIGEINVNAPHAKDANGIARDMQRALRSHPVIVQSNTSLE